MQPVFEQRAPGFTSSFFTLFAPCRSTVSCSPAYWPLLAGALPLAGFAQTEAPAAPRPRYFVGLGLYQTPPSYLVYSTFMPLVPMAGVQLRPRLALQASVAFRQQRFFYENSFSGYDYSGGTPGQPYDFT